MHEGYSGHWSGASSVLGAGVGRGESPGSDGVPGGGLFHGKDNRCLENQRIATGANNGGQYSVAISSICVDI